MAMTDEQRAQAERLHGAVAWVYPSTDDAAFWDRFFNQSVPELTPQEQASGITLGPYGPGQQQAAYEQEQAALAQPPAPQVLPPAAGGGTTSQPGGGGFSPAGAGTGLFNSSLIQALRQASPPFTSSNPGITMRPNVATPGAAVRRSVAPSGLSFKPPILTIAEAPPEPEKTAAAPPPAPGTVRDEISRAYEASDGADSAPSSGGSSVGQGINTGLTDLGLGLMAYGEAGKGIAPGSLAAGLVGGAIADHQIDAISDSFDALAEIEAAAVPGVVAVSDQHGNVFGYSSPATIAAADAAMFGGPDDGAAEGGNTAANAAAEAAAEAAGLAAADGVGMSGFGSTGDVGGDGSGGDGGDCFLTTAAVKHMGQDDKGEVLNTLRRFRDEFMLADEDKRADVAAYYKNAPQIVEAINARPDAKSVYQAMYEAYILPAVDAIKDGDNKKAYDTYVAGVDWARKEAAHQWVD